MRPLLIVSIVLLFSACQPSRIINRQMDKKYARHGLSFRKLNTNTHSISYWDNESTKPPLILIHGFGTWSKFNWHKQIKELGEHYRLIIPNLLHFGKSTCSNCGYQVSDQTAAMSILIDKLNLINYRICGVSYGGLVAIELALNRPNDIRKLIIVDSPVKFFSKEEVAEVENYFSVSSISQLLVPDQHKGLKKLTTIIYRHPPPAPTFLYREIYDSMFEPYRNDMIKLLDNMLNKRAFFAAQAYDFDFPILLLWGKEDKLVPTRVGKNLHDYFGDNSQLEVIEKTAHMPILEKPKACNRIILNFLDE